MPVPASLVDFRPSTVVSDTGCTRVLRGRDPRNRNAVAVKVITAPENLPAMGARIERFRRHTAALQGARRAVMPEILQLGAEDSRRMFLITRWKEGETLAIPIGLDIRKLVGELAAVLEALEELARFGEAHLNVRPNNLFWSGGRLHLLGLATRHFLDVDPDAFVAPELPGLKATSGRLWRADMFAFARTVCTVLGAQVEGSATSTPFVQFPDAVGDHLRAVGGLRLVMESALCQQPACRPDSFGVIHRALLDSIKPPTASYPLGGTRVAASPDSPRRGRSSAESKVLVFRAEHQSEPVAAEELAANRRELEPLGVEADSELDSEPDSEPGGPGKRSQTGLTAELDRALVDLRAELVAGGSDQGVDLNAAESPSEGDAEETCQSANVEEIKAPLLEMEVRQGGSPVELPISEILAFFDRPGLPPERPAPVVEAESGEEVSSEGTAAVVLGDGAPLGPGIDVTATRPESGLRLRPPVEVSEAAPDRSRPFDRRAQSRRRVLWMLLAAAVLVWSALLGVELFQKWLLRRVVSDSIGTLGRTGVPFTGTRSQAVELPASPSPSPAPGESSSQPVPGLSPAESRFAETVDGATVDENEATARSRVTPRSKPLVAGTLSTSGSASGSEESPTLSDQSSAAPEPDEHARSRELTQAELTRLDRGAPTLVLSAASRQAQSGGGVVRLDAADDYEIRRLEVFARQIGALVSEPLEVRPLGGVRYEVVVPPRLRMGRSVLLWGRAWDRSGHQGGWGVRPTRFVSG